MRHIGSSPLTRGKQTERGDEVYTLRLIPAHAGKTPFPSVRALRAGAHPRSRGENNQFSLPSPVSDGSSPLTRGKLAGIDGGDVGAGLIPAHAGKTLINEDQENPNAAHPRSRGENSSMDHIVRSESGSSPLTRGKPYVRQP